MRPLLLVHVVAGALVVVLAAVVAVVGLAMRRRLRLGGPGRGDRIYTQLVALVQTAIVACGLFGLMVLADPGGPDDRLHVRVYGPFMLVAMLGAYSFRTGDRRRNATVFAVACLFVAGLGVRALTTG